MRHVIIANSADTGPAFDSALAALLSLSSSMAQLVHASLNREQIVRIMGDADYYREMAASNIGLLFGRRYDPS